MATALEQQRLRLDLGIAATDTTTLPDADIDAIFVEAGETYTTTAAIKASTRVIAIRRLLASAAKLTSYTQNNSSESASDVFKHLQELLKLWTDELATAAGEESASARSAVARFGRTTRRPARIYEVTGGESLP